MTWSTSRARTVKPPDLQRVVDEHQEEDGAGDGSDAAVERRPHVTFSHGRPPRGTAPTQPVEPEKQEDTNDRTLEEPSGCGSGQEDNEPSEKRRHEVRYLTAEFVERSLILQYMVALPHPKKKF